MIELDLRDIQLPDGLPWWPPAPGWWLLMLFLVVVTALIWWYWRRYRNPLKLAALRELSRLREAHAAGAEETHTLAEISVLLRRIAISRLGREPAAGITGDAWRACLDNLSENCRFDSVQLDLLTGQRFRQNPDCNIEGLLHTCEKWIRNLPRDGKHASA